MSMDAGSLRRWLDARQAAEAREREELRAAPPSSAEAWRQALGLIAFAARRYGWPLPDDPQSVREDALGYARWQRLRATWRTRGRSG